jgi:hypothetical protein
MACVTLYEEPTLCRQFGAQYDAYRSAVPGWWPRLHPWRGWPPSSRCTREPYLRTALRPVRATRAGRGPAAYDTCWDHNTTIKRRRRHAQQRAATEAGRLDDVDRRLLPPLMRA